jgi:hypothetical protein
MQTIYLGDYAAVGVASEAEQLGMWVGTWQPQVHVEFERLGADRGGRAAERDRRTTPLGGSTLWEPSTPDAFGRAAA